MELRYILFAVLLCNAAVSVRSTANPKANERTKKLLAALSKVGDRILTGAFGGYNRFEHAIGFSMYEANRIQKVTNKLPAIYGIDCSPGWKTTEENHETDIIDCFNSEAVDYAKKGGIITVSHHLRCPAYPGYQVIVQANETISNDVYTNILTDGTPERNRWLKVMDKVAQGLRGYKDQGVTILYRPFHEMNGDWFWWGATKDKSQNGERQRLFKLLWQDLFNFMQNKGLDNLLWVFSPGSTESPTDFYPGDNFVDIAALDCYPDDPTKIAGYDKMLSLGKPFAFAEVGPSTQDGNYDYDFFVKTMLSQYPKAVYFMSWNDVHSPAYNKKAWEAYNNPKVINLGELKV